MRKELWLVALLISPLSFAGSFEECKGNTAATSCSAYLNGVVDSALLLGEKQVRARFGETFAERALSQRAGERVKRSDKHYCADRLPNKMALKQLLIEQFNANKVDSISDMYDILAIELNCYRSPRQAQGTTTDVAS